MSHANFEANNLGLLLDNLLAFPGARHALLLAHDGSLRAHPWAIDQAEAARQAGAFSALHSASRNAAELCGQEQTPWEQTLIEFAGGCVFLLSVDATCYLAVSASSGADVPMLALRIHRLADQLAR
ncbi:putative regulator of Ras-like GTPase activity (Roadblock/LC7/MglB family) [Streptomyces sp. TLI_235]|nr:roadblock/LC7 domain-containing protein [Streptomyces sp. TLI_235]PBC69594.1 putative regulator of Ras-like GTPase activity (Roadblock/LC7/MglB family) [Streptomyces sp. TLI_235]